MTRKTNLAISAVLAALAAFFVWKYARSLEGRHAGAEPEVTILRAARTLERGTVISEDDLVPAGVPAAYVPAQAVYATDLTDALENKTYNRIVQGDYLLWTDIAGTDDAQAFLLTIQPEMRAISLPVNPATAVGGLLLPGDRVDVYAAMPSSDPTSRNAEILPVLENAPIIAVGDLTAPTLDLERKERAYRTVTVLVDLTEIPGVTYFIENGDLLLTLRNPADPSILVVR